MKALRAFWRSPTLKSLAFAALLIGLASLVATVDLRPSLSHLAVGVYSGSPSGSYFRITEGLAEAARLRSGEIRNQPSQGSADNLARLAAGADDCSTPFALVQDGLAPAGPHDLQLLGRLQKAETVFVLSAPGKRYESFESLRGVRVGIGPEGSGANRLASSVFALPELSKLGTTLVALPNEAAFDAVQAGSLDLAIVVIDEDAELIKNALLVRKLEIAPIAHVDAIARRFPFLRTGRIGAGQYDAVALLPPTDRTVLRVDTLVVVHSCAVRSQKIAMLSLLADALPDFVRHNQETPNRTGLPLSDASRQFFQNGGPEFLDTWMPRVSDVMPPENWVYTVMGISILFNIMGFGHRFRLWRIDANRVNVEMRIGRVFGPTTTVDEIGALEPAPEHRRPETLRALDEAIASLEGLNDRCRTQSLSMLVPMGGEMAYRYQETLMADALANLRRFRRRLG